MNSPLEVQDFRGGKTDFFLSAEPFWGQEFDNLLIDSNKKPYSRFGSQIRSTDAGAFLTDNGNKRCGYIWDHRDISIEQSERGLYKWDTVYAELLGPTGNKAFAVGDEDTHISKSFWNNHSFVVSDSFSRPVKIYKDGSNVFQLRTAGLPEITAPTVVGVAGVNNYIYGFLYYYTYIVEGVTFEDFGPTVQVQLQNVNAPDVDTVNITNIPVIANGVTDNWDTANIKVKIYRTENNLTTLKFIGEVTNGTTIYDDSASDASITNNVVIYTTGDVVDNNTPPPAKFIHTANDIAMYAYPFEDGVGVPNKVRQSIKGDLDSCPLDFFDEFPDEIVGISSIQSTFIVFCRNSAYRMDGFFDEQGGGGISHIKISDTIGCVSNDSIVQTDDGLYFAGPQGFYYCDGYKIMKITNQLTITYPELTKTVERGRNIFGAYDKNDRRIWWACQLHDSSLDNDTCFILDLQFGLSDSMCFTTASNGTSFRPTALMFKDNQMYRADTRGYVFIHDVSYLTDPRVDTLFVPSTWVKKTIIYNYKSAAYNFGTSFVRKFVPKILLTIANLTNIATKIVSINDDGKSTRDLTEIRYMSNILWGDPDVVWSTPDIIWNKSGLIEEKRMFPAKGLRCNYKQIQITNSKTIIINSDTSGTATIDQVALTATLNLPLAGWPQDVVDYYLTLENDNYTREYQVRLRNSDSEILVYDPEGMFPADGIYKWEIKGYRKGDAIQILSYVIHFKMITDSQKTFHTGDLGGNA